MKMLWWVISDLFFHVHNKELDGESQTAKQQQSFIENENKKKVQARTSEGREEYCKTAQQPQSLFNGQLISCKSK
jgi:hypothetical protein